MEGTLEGSWALVLGSLIWESKTVARIPEDLGVDLLNPYLYLFPTLSLALALTNIFFALASDTISTYTSSSFARVASTIHSQRNKNELPRSEIKWNQSQAFPNCWNLTYSIIFHTWYRGKNIHLIYSKCNEFKTGAESIFQPRKLEIQGRRRVEEWCFLRIKNITYGYHPSK